MRDAPAEAAPEAPLEAAWRALDRHIQESWDRYLAAATEREIRDDDGTTSLLFLPFPYMAPFNEEGHRAMFAWDTYFINRALISHGRLELVRHHILNYLFMITRFGYMPNANIVQLRTRSQPPVFPDSILEYAQATGDHDLLLFAYPLLKREYGEYWHATHHSTPVGLATNRDLGDPFLPGEYAAEAETGLDWTPIYGGDARRCVPLITNCALVRYARVLAEIAARLGFDADRARFTRDADKRAERIRRYCWSDELGLFLEYDYVRGVQLPYVSDCTFWPLWTGVATPEQARRVTSNLGRLEHEHGIVCTEKAYDDPHDVMLDISEVAITGAVEGERGQLQWMYPAGWACMQIVAVEGLDRYGRDDLADRIATRFLRLVAARYEDTGSLWEKYNVVDGSTVLPNSRYGNAPMPTSWTTAAAVLFGQRLFGDQSRTS